MRENEGLGNKRKIVSSVGRIDVEVTHIHLENDMRAIKSSLTNFCKGENSFY